jgi:hypothetical protein
VTVDLRETTATVDVEILVLTCPGPGLGYQVRRDALGAGEEPDEAARRLAPATGLEVLHSTSWRFEAGRVVLTYAAVAAGEPRAPGDVLPLQEPAVLSSGDPLAPAPPALHLHHVVAHAVRHLAQLAGSDPAVAAAASRSAAPELWTAIREASRDMPTGTHAEAHRAAVRRRAGRTP